MCCQSFAQLCNNGAQMAQQASGGGWSVSLQSQLWLTLLQPECACMHGHVLGSAKARWPEIGFAFSWDGDPFTTVSSTMHTLMITTAGLDGRHSQNSCDLFLPRRVFFSKALSCPILCSLSGSVMNLVLYLQPKQHHRASQIIWGLSCRACHAEQQFP